MLCLFFGEKRALLLIFMLFASLSSPSILNHCHKKVEANRAAVWDPNQVQAFSSLRFLTLSRLYQEKHEKLYTNKQIPSLLLFFWLGTRAMFAQASW